MPIGVSLADYFFHSNVRNEKTLQDMIEKQDGFRINRKGFAKDMLEMILVLLEQNLAKLKNAENKKNNHSKKADEEVSLYLSVHNNLIQELEKIMIQFGDVLEPSIFIRIQNIFMILKDWNIEDYLAARHLILKTLTLLGQNILFTQ
ncbi:MAG TPA: hypothetical protein VFG24_04780 [Nitrosopumilaceae archaeon]|nr:hypothetical protein [Nitrosopumilaceae archaeon]